MKAAHFGTNNICTCPMFSSDMWVKSHTYYPYRTPTAILMHQIRPRSPFIPTCFHYTQSQIIPLASSCEISLALTNSFTASIYSSFHLSNPGQNYTMWVVAERNSSVLSIKEDVVSAMRLPWLLGKSCHRYSCVGRYSSLYPQLHNYISSWPTYHTLHMITLS